MTPSPDTEAWAPVTGPRLVEVQLLNDLPSPLVVRVGDVLLIRVSGGRALRGRRAVEVLGPFMPAVATAAGVLSPMGAPNGLLVRTLHPGKVTLQLATGDPWSGAGTTTLQIVVKP